MTIIDRKNRPIVAMIEIIPAVDSRLLMNSSAGTAEIKISRIDPTTIGTAITRLVKNNRQAARDQPRWKPSLNLSCSPVSFRVVHHPDQGDLTDPARDPGNNEQDQPQAQQCNDQREALAANSAGPDSTNRSIPLPNDSKPGASLPAIGRIH